MNLLVKNIYHGLRFKEMKLMNDFFVDDSDVDIVSFKNILFAVRISIKVINENFNLTINRVFINGLFYI